MGMRVSPIAWTNVRGRDVVENFENRRRGDESGVEVAFVVVNAVFVGDEKGDGRGSEVRLVCFLRILRVASELASENYARVSTMVETDIEVKATFLMFKMNKFISMNCCKATRLCLSLKFRRSAKPRFVACSTNSFNRCSDSSSERSLRWYSPMCSNTSAST